MPSRTQQHVQRHFQRLFERDGVEVVYARLEAQNDVTAVPGRTGVTVDDGAGLSVRSKERDWILRASELVLDGELITPAEGDRIRLSEKGKTTVYEVQRLAGQDCWYECDDLGTVLRVHTRKIDTELT